MALSPTLLQTPVVSKKEVKIKGPKKRIYKEEFANLMESLNADISDVGFDNDD